MRPILVVLFAAAAAAQQPVFMKPEPSGVYVRLTDPAELGKLQKWLQIPSAQMALELYADARRLAQARGLAKEQPAEYHIAIEQGGNYPAFGFRLKDGDTVKEHRQAGFIKLNPSEDFFRSTLFHETGHVASGILSAGKELRGKPMASLPHSNAALTDRVTAFQEGFGIHFETTAAHVVNEPAMRNRYRHEQILAGPVHGRLSEYSRAASDLMTFAQVVGRYYDIRENAFAFESAFQEPDYVRVQYEKSRDFATLRGANQLLQSEGFYATFFFSLVARGDAAPSREVVRERHARILDALADMYASKPLDADSPFLLHFVESYVKRYPDEKEAVVDLLLDLSHGVFVDPNAPRVWRDYYLAALRLDLEKVRSGSVEALRKQWRETVLKDPAVLFSRLGPQIRCVVNGVQVGLVAFGRQQPLAFDINTAQKGVLRMIPGISDAEVSRWLDQRAQKPFASAADFRTRVALSEPAAAALTLN